MTKAAAALRISQPAASYSLEKLRTTFDDPLFERSKRRLQPTPLCAQLYQAARATLAQINALGQPAEEEAELAGQVTVVAVTNAYRFFDAFCD